MAVTPNAAITGAETAILSFISAHRAWLQELFRGRKAFAFGRTTIETSDRGRAGGMQCASLLVVQVSCAACSRLRQ